MMSNKQNKQKLGKKAITPLMGTILLVSFAVAVGMVVMNLGRAEVENSAICPVDIGFNFVTIGGEQQLCYDKEKLTFTVENGVNVNIEGLVVSVIGKEKADTLELNDAKMSKAGSYVGKAAFDAASGGEIRQIKISPKVLLKGEEQICADQALVVEEIPAC